MRVGFVVECHRDGADYQVIDYLVRELRGDIDARFSCCGSKRALFEDCGKLVEALFDVERCERVFVIWDLEPCDQDFRCDDKPSCEKERAFLLKTLRKQDVHRTVLLCITHELEAWLLADGKALTTVLWNKNHPIKPIQDDKQPERYPNPKKLLNKLFNQHRGRDYDDKVHALRIIEKMNIKKLARAPSFVRLKAKLKVL